MNATHYCDRCGAQAKARFFLQSGDLIFCGHHAREYDEKLVEQGAIYDIEYSTENNPEMAAV